MVVQVQAPSATSDDPVGTTRRSKPSLGAAPVGIWQEVPVRSSSPHGATPNGHAQSQPSSPAAEPLSRDSPPPGVEVLHFVKYCHLVPAEVCLMMLPMAGDNDVLAAGCKLANIGAFVCSGMQWLTHASVTQLHLAAV